MPGLLLNSIPLALRSTKRVKESSADMTRKPLRRVQNKAVYFNFKIFSDEQGLRIFFCPSNNTGVLGKLVGYSNNPTARSGYRCNPVLVICIVTRRLASPCRGKTLRFSSNVGSTSSPKYFGRIYNAMKVNLGRG